jgi:hypothetical protein
LKECANLVAKSSIRCFGLCLFVCLFQVSRVVEPHWDEFFRYKIQNPHKTYLAIALVSSYTRPIARSKGLQTGTHPLAPS